tara:strand:+ start:868 stop:2001 length:1134 start_codon:yes stop_codon:yes gene_type:complete
MSSLLEEAIVDAKALKEAALKNAENAVLEKYSAEVKGALSTLLEQDEFGLGDMGMGEEAPKASASFIEDIPYGFQNEELDSPPENELIEIDFNALKTRIAEEEAQGIEPSPDELASSEEVAMELQESGLTQIQSKGSAGEDEASMSPDKSSVVDPAAIEAGDEDMEELEEGEDEDIALTEEMLSDLIEELVVDMKPVPQGWASLNSADNGVEQANNDAMAAAHDAHLEEAEELEEEEETAPDVTHMVYEDKIKELKESLKGLYALLTESKNQLTKLNLENAKLVYQNKALNSASLNERQKNKIVEAVQSANSVEEARMLYETIQNAVGAPHSKSTRPQTLREAVMRPASLLINSKKNNEATHDPKMDRMLRLAGLNK